VGRLDREKNLPLLLEAFRRAADARPDARLVLVGRGTRAEALGAEVRRWPAGARIRFAGGVEPARVAAYYRAADAFLFASTTETQGLAVLEAMATGLPVVAVRASGVEEAIVDGVSGRLVAEDARLLAEAALEILADPHLAAKLGAGALERAATFAAGELADRLVALYRDLRASRP
jgi:glycosyltransferase involved in cell wall biosynthesis